MNSLFQENLAKHQLEENFLLKNWKEKIREKENKWKCTYNDLNSNIECSIYEYMQKQWKYRVYVFQCSNTMQICWLGTRL